MKGDSLPPSTVHKSLCFISSRALLARRLRGCGHPSPQLARLQHDGGALHCVLWFSPPGVGPAAWHTGQLRTYLLTEPRDDGAIWNEDVPALGMSQCLSSSTRSTDTLKVYLSLPKLFLRFSIRKIESVCFCLLPRPWFWGRQPLLGFFFFSLLRIGTFASTKSECG